MNIFGDFYKQVLLLRTASSAALFSGHLLAFGLLSLFLDSACIASSEEFKIFCTNTVSRNILIWFHDSKGEQLERHISNRFVCIW